MEDELSRIVDEKISEEVRTINERFSSPVIKVIEGLTASQKLDTLLLLHVLNTRQAK